MKISNVIKVSTGKLTKGIFGMFTVYLCLFGVFSFIQSCQSVDNSLEPISQSSAIDDFENLLSRVSPDMQQFISEKLTNLNQQSLESGDVPFELEEETKQILNPLLEGSKTFLKAYGFNESDIQYILNGEDEYKLIPMVLLMHQIEKSKVQEQAAFKASLNFFSFFGHTAMAREDIDWGKVGGCAATALGLDIFVSLAPEVGGKHDKWTRKGLRKLFGKVASRMLGPIGVMIAGGSFIACMYDISFW